MGENLQTYCIKNNLEYLLEQWHPTKNGNLRPTDVTAGCSKKVFWLLPYDDPNTGKHHEFEWEARIVDRVIGSGCPYLTGQAVWPGFNDLSSLYPEIAKEWHPSKNGKLKPTDVTAGSGKKVFWLCPIGHIYKSAICERTCGNSNCSICAKESKTSFPEQAIYYYIKQAFHDAASGDTKTLDNKKELDIYIPSIHTAIEYDGKRWHKNAKRDITKNYECADKKLILIRIREEGCPEMEENEYLKIIKCKPNDIKSLEDAIQNIGKHLGIAFNLDIEKDRTVIYSQYIKSIKENSLAIKYPELAKEWNFKQNGQLTPEMVSYGSSKKVWWYLPYDDPITMKHFDFEWPASIGNRVRGDGCPFLSNKAVWQGFNDLATTHPELAKQWHPTRNGDLKPTDVTAGSGGKFWWYLPYDDPITGKHFDFEWPARMTDRVNGVDCPYLTGNAIWKGFNDLATTHPELAKQWHPTMNGDLKPTDVTAGSEGKFWWYLPYDDPVTMKHFDFEWPASVKNRAKGSGCPFLKNKAVWQGFNDLATTHPELAKQWHPTRNGDLKPSDITFGHQKNVWWLLPYTDSKTGEHFDFEWPASIISRANGGGCPYLTGRTIWKGFNDLATTHPELAKQWHPTKNNNCSPTDVTAGSHKKVWWYLPYDDPITGKHFDFEWPAVIQSRANGRDCPFLTGKAVWKGFNDLATTYPEIADEWHPTKNGNLKPTDITAGSHKEVYWINSEGKTQKEKIYKRTSKTKNRTEKYKKTLASSI